MRFVDSHVHLSDYEDPLLVLKHCRPTGTLLLAASTDRQSSETTTRLAKEQPETCYPFVGLHPSETAERPDVSWLPGLLHRAQGVGEIGLDPKYSSTLKGGAQMRAFEAQLEAAQGANKPVQVHSRGAEEECLEELAGFRLPAVLLHWFQGDSMLSRVRDQRYFVSFGPALLGSKKLRVEASLLDRDRVLAESDGPVPFAALGGAAGPMLIPSVVFCLSSIWRVAFEEARETVARNAMEFAAAGGKVITPRPRA